MVALLQQSPSHSEAPRPVTTDNALATFYRVYPEALPVMRADRTALGTLPAAALQHCEAICTASAFGWYVFPAHDLSIWFDGTDIFIEIADEWVRLASLQLPGSEQWWNPYVGDELQNSPPPFVTALGMPGYMQVWSGSLIESRPGWSTLVRPLANVTRNAQISCFEGLVETDQFAPSPLFTNLRVCVTNRRIVLPADEPLFQVQVLPRETYSARSLSSAVCVDMFDDDCDHANMLEAKLQGYGNTIRTANMAESESPSGRYARAVRKRARQGSAD